jgi:hypothetical protein
VKILLVVVAVLAVIALAFDTYISVQTFRCTEPHARLGSR